MHLFGQLKRIVREWLEDGYLRYSGGTTPAQLIYQEITDMACDRIKTAIDESQTGDRPIRAILDAYNPVGSTAHVSFTTSKETRWKTDARRSQVNWVVCDSRLGGGVLSSGGGAFAGAIGCEKSGVGVGGSLFTWVGAAEIFAGFCGAGG